MNTRTGARAPAVKAPRGDRRGDIVAAARRLFERQGYDDTTMIDIAQALDLAEGTLYLYFPSKRELVVAVALSWFEEITDDTERQAGAIANRRSRLQFLIQRHLEMITGNAKMYLLYIREVRAAPTYGGSVGKALNRRYTDLLRPCLEGGANSGLAFPVARDLVYGGTEHVAWSGIVRGDASPARLHELSVALAEAFARALCLDDPASDDLGSRLTRIEQVLGLGSATRAAGAGAGDPA